MKKPERKYVGRGGGYNNVIFAEYNSGHDELDIYYKQLIKENYIKKDKLPGVAELVGILDAHRHCSISMQVRKLLERIRKGK